MGPLSSISPLALPSSLYPVASKSSGSSGMVRKQLFGNKKMVLKSMVTEEEFVLGMPQDSLVCRRRMRTREERDLTIAGEINQTLAKQCKQTLPDPPTPSTTRSLPYLLTESGASTVDQVGSCASSECFAINPSCDAGFSVSVNSARSLVDQAAPGFFELTSTTNPISALNDAESIIEDAAIEHATTGMPFPIPTRGPSLLHLRILEAGLASRARRPILADTDDDDVASAVVTHHPNLIPTTFEIGTATAVRLYRPPPVRLIVVRGRVVTMNQANAQAMNAPWEIASVLNQGDEVGCTSRPRFWSKLKRKFRRG